MTCSISSMIPHSCWWHGSECGATDWPKGQYRALSRPHNFVCDPATLIVAFDRVAGNTGANTPGVDGLTVTDVENVVGVPGFLGDLRVQLKDGAFRPLPVRERTI